MIEIDQLLTAFNSGGLALWGPFSVLVLCGLGLPIPEDIVLITAGYLAATQNTSFFVSALVMYFGIMIGDGIIFYAGRKIGSKLLQTRLGTMIVNPHRLGKAMHLFEKYGVGVIFLARFLPGLRTPIFFTAGTLRYSPFNFLSVDGFAAIISAPAFVWIGHWAYKQYGDDIGHLQRTLGKTQIGILGFALLLALIIFSVLWKRSRKSTPRSTTTT